MGLHEVSGRSRVIPGLLFAALLVSTMLTAVIAREKVDATIDGAGCVVDPDDVIAWWKGEDNLLAEIGPDLIGTVAFDDSVTGRGMRFDGANVIGVDDFPTVDDAVSLSMWIKPVDSGLIQELMSRWDFPSTDDSARSFDLRLNGQSLVWSTDETSTRGPEELAATVPQLFDGEFHHVAATWDSLTTALYVDGVPVATAPSQGGALNAAATTSFRLGSKPGTGNPFSFTGVIDEPAIIGRALTASEVAALDRSGPNGLCTPGTTVDVFGPNLEIQDDVGAVDPVWTLDGRYLLFRTRSSDLLPVVVDPLLQTPGTDFDQLANDRDDLVLLDTKGTSDASDDILELVSVNSDELGGGLDSYQGAMTPTASHVAFASLSKDLVPGDTLSGGEVFIRNRLDGTTERISVRSDGSQPQYATTGLNNDSGSPSVDDSGTVVAFESTNRDLAAEANPVPGDTWETYDIYVRDMSDPNPANHTTERITIGLGDTKANGSSTAPLLSSDGRYVWFSSSASNLVADDTNGQIDLFAHDRQTGTTSRVDFTGGPGVPSGGGVTVDDDRSPPTPVDSGSGSGLFGAPVAHVTPEKRATTTRSEIGFSVGCKFTHSLRDDPIVFPGQPGRAHLHDFFGSEVTDAGTTLAQLAGSDTSCTSSNDRSAYWVPALYVDGTKVTPGNTTFYYKPGVDPRTSVKPIPLGMQMIAGNAMATRPENPGIMWFQQGNIPPINSSNGTVPSKPQLRITFPDCWDGVRLSSTDRSHLVYHTGARKCPPSHPVPIVQLTMFVQYSEGPNLTVASGDWFTMHADFINAWNPQTMQALVNECIVPSVRCGKVFDVGSN